MKTKICIIGCGRFARYAHGPSYQLIRQNDPDVEYAACADMAADKAESFAAQFGFPRFYDDWRKMVDTEKPDGVCVLTGVGDTARTASGTGTVFHAAGRCVIIPTFNKTIFIV